ncbi:MAG: hypothetical protein WD895_03070 [Acidimicrobiia bacterium]
MRISLPRLIGPNCEHENVVVVRSAGLERTVCEQCGHVSFSFDQDDLDLIQADPAVGVSIGADTH